MFTRKYLVSTASAKMLRIVFTDEQYTKIGGVLPASTAISDIAKQDRGWITGALKIQFLVYRLGLLTEKCALSPQMTCSVLLLKNRSSRRKSCLISFAQHKEQTGKKTL